LQALTTLNETLFMECARRLALEVVTNAGPTDAERMTSLVRRCLARDPRPEEIEVLRKFLTRQKLRFSEGGTDPWPLITADDSDKEKLQAELNDRVPAAELAAWTALARVVLNLDETITKE
jgi:hypothetical protein